MDFCLTKWVRPPPPHTQNKCPTFVVPQMGLKTNVPHLLFPKWGSKQLSLICCTQMGRHGDPTKITRPYNWIATDNATEKKIKIKSRCVPHKNALLFRVSFELCLIGKQSSRQWPRKDQRNHSKRRARTSVLSILLRQLIFITFVDSAYGPGERPGVLGPYSAQGRAMESQGVTLGPSTTLRRVSK